MPQPFQTHGWRIESKHDSRIMESAKMEEWEHTLEATGLPEMIFGDNHVAFHHDPSGLTIAFNCFDALKGALHREGEEDIPVVTYAADWRRKDHGLPGLAADAVATAPRRGLRWTYQTDYEGTLSYAGSSDRTVPAVESEDGVNYEMLKDTSLPILCSDSAVLYEDELHDCGVSRCLVRFRVMPTCFFILLRHWLRVDNVVSRLRDTRFFHEFGTEWVVREVSVRSLALPKAPACDAADVPFPRYDNPDEHQHLMTPSLLRITHIPLL